MGLGWDRAEPGQGVVTGAAPAAARPLPRPLPAAHLVIVPFRSNRSSGRASVPSSSSRSLSIPPAPDPCGCTSLAGRRAPLCCCCLPGNGTTLPPLPLLFTVLLAYCLACPWEQLPGGALQSLLLPCRCSPLLLPEPGLNWLRPSASCWPWSRADLSCCLSRCCCCCWCQECCEHCCCDAGPPPSPCEPPVPLLLPASRRPVSDASALLPPLTGAGMLAVMVGAQPSGRPSSHAASKPSFHTGSPAPHGAPIAPHRTREACRPASCATLLVVPTENLHCYTERMPA